MAVHIMDIGGGGKRVWWDGPQESNRPNLVLLKTVARKLSVSGFAPKKLTDDEKGAITDALKMYFNSKHTIASLDRQGLLAKVNEIIGFNNPTQPGALVTSKATNVEPTDDVRAWHAPDTVRAAI